MFSPIKINLYRFQLSSEEFFKNYAAFEAVQRGKLAKYAIPDLQICERKHGLL